MSISALMIEWVSRLNKNGIIGQGMDMLELGPQDISSTRTVVRNVDARHVTNVDAAVHRIFPQPDSDQPAKGSQEFFYSLFGLGPYSSADYFDPSARFRLDLNRPCQALQQFQVVTNFGTSEHVFNVGQSFATTHEFLADNGVALFVLPTFGHIDHGFYNIHPTLYQDMALANNYTIEDFLYIDNFGVRNRLLERGGATPFDFDALPIKLKKQRTKKAYEEECALTREVTFRFVENFCNPLTKEHGWEFPPIIFDYCFVAMRKNPQPNRTGFVIPAQGIYG